MQVIKENYLFLSSKARVTGVSLAVVTDVRQPEVQPDDAAG